VEARRVTRVFGSGPALVNAVNQVDLSIPPGTVTLIMGPSGSGKTTLLTMLGALLRPTSGSILLFGTDIAGLPESQLPAFRRGLLGFVFQSFNLLESLTAIQNVEVALNLNGVKGQQARQHAESLLVQMGLEERLRFRPNLLSGGERQRVSIARALANDPPLILADEPTANLDSEHGHDVVARLRRLSQEAGKTVIIVSHDARIADAADVLLWMEDGRLREETRAGVQQRSQP
jgi:putative ABC transport system ATP-binding protein